MKCAFAAERYVPEKMESFYVRNLFQVDQISDRHQSSDVLNEKFEVKCNVAKDLYKKA